MRRFQNSNLANGQFKKKKCKCCNSLQVRKIVRLKKEFALFGGALQTSNNDTGTFTEELLENCVITESFVSFSSASINQETQDNAMCVVSVTHRLLSCLDLDLPMRFAASCIFEGFTCIFYSQYTRR
jgi:hypothetical protein